MRTKKEIEAEIEELFTQFKEECKEIAEQCEEEGYPNHGSNYDLRCENVWDDYYGPAVAELEDELDRAEAD